MINQELISYIKNALAQGKSAEMIKTSLTPNGWSSYDIDEAFRTLNPIVQTKESNFPILKKYLFWMMTVAIVVFAVMKVFSLTQTSDINVASNITTDNNNSINNPAPTQTPIAPVTPPVPIENASPSTVIVPPVLTPPVMSPMQSTGTLFTETRRSYIIFPNLASGASRALDGFNMTTESLGNNLYRITLTPKVNNYKTQTFVLTGDDSLYFFETSFGDDNSSQDYVYNDDYAVAVNSQGYILK